jgi:hypothetical protein
MFSLMPTHIYMKYELKFIKLIMFKSKFCYFFCIPLKVIASAIAPIAFFRKDSAKFYSPRFATLTERVIIFLHSKVLKYHMIIRNGEDELPTNNYRSRKSPT